VNSDGSGCIRVLTQVNSSCVYTGVPPNLSAATGGGNQTIAVGTAGLPDWIALTGPSAVTGPGSMPLSQAGAQGSPNLCDINQDGVVNVMDVQFMIGQALGKLAALNDLNGDGIANVVDVEIDSNAALNLGCAVDQPNIAAPSGARNQESE
jgi:hypothetical protein